MRLPRFFPENPIQKKIVIYSTFAMGIILAIQARIFKRFQDSIRGFKSLSDEEFNMALKILEPIKHDLTKIVTHLRQEVTPWSDNQIILAFILALLTIYFAQIQIMSHLGIGRRQVENVQPPNAYQNHPHHG